MELTPELHNVHKSWLPNARLHKSRGDDPPMRLAPMMLPSRATGHLNPMTLVHFCRNFRARGKREPPPGHRTFTCPNSSRISRASKSSPNFRQLTTTLARPRSQSILESIRQNGKRLIILARPQVRAHDEMHDEDGNRPPRPTTSMTILDEWMGGIKRPKSASLWQPLISTYCRRLWMGCGNAYTMARALC